MPSMPAKTAVPGGREIAPGEEEGGRVRRPPARPRSVISKTPISSVGPKRFFTARRMRKWWPVSPSKETTASTMCSTTRGPAIWPSLVTWPTRITAVPVVLAKRISAWALPRTCVTVPGADSTVSVHMVWIESMTASAGGRPCARVATMSSTLVSAASSTCAGRQPEALGAQAHLRDRLFARDVDDALARAGPSRRRPASGASTCRCRDRRRSGSPSRARSRRRRPGRARRCRRPSAAPRGPRPRGPRGERRAPWPGPAASPRARRGRRRRRSPRRWCSSRCRPRNGPSSGYRRRRSSGRRRRCCSWPWLSRRRG